MKPFQIIPGPYNADELRDLTRRYDEIVSEESVEKRVGSTTTRVHGLVNRGTIFDALYVYGPLIEICTRAMRRPFKLSSLLARSVRPFAPVQELHADVEEGQDGWPMIGFILMIDDFRADNGATRFAIDGGEPVLACGTAGSLIVFNASVMHGHSANQISEPRRSIQGTFIPREATQVLTVDEETRRRLGLLGRYVLAI